MSELATKIQKTINNITLAPNNLDHAKKLYTLGLQGFKDATYKESQLIRFPFEIITSAVLDPFTLTRKQRFFQSNILGIFDEMTQLEYQFFKTPLSTHYRCVDYSILKQLLKEQGFTPQQAHFFAYES